MSDKRPLVLVTAGDPAGIGPEIALRALAADRVSAVCRAALVCDMRIAERAAGIVSSSALLKRIDSPEEGEYREGLVNIIDVENAAPSDCTFGQVQSLCGAAAYQYIEKSVRFALAGRADAITTAPLNKEALRAAGIPYIDHTEIFSELTGDYDPVTMFEVDELRIFFLTRHMSLRKACDMVTAARIKECAVKCLAMLRQLGLAEGRMAIAALNPHGGEHGLFGDEETEEIIPAVKEMQEQGLPVEGPIGADSVFHLARTGQYNSVLSLYHDQGHIAAKTLDFERTVSVTGGMKLLRTSVDHGTAFDIAGSGKASEKSMIEAICTAAKYAVRRSV